MKYLIVIVATCFLGACSDSHTTEERELIEAHGDTTNVSNPENLRIATKEEYEKAKPLSDDSSNAENKKRYDHGESQEVEDAFSRLFDE